MTADETDSTKNLFAHFLALSVNTRGQFQRDQRIETNQVHCCLQPKRSFYPPNRNSRTCRNGPNNETQIAADRVNRNGSHQLVAWND